MEKNEPQEKVSWIWADPNWRLDFPCINQVMVERRHFEIGDPYQAKLIDGIGFMLASKDEGLFKASLMQVRVEVEINCKIYFEAPLYTFVAPGLSQDDKIGDGLIRGEQPLLSRMLKIEHPLLINPLVGALVAVRFPKDLVDRINRDSHDVDFHFAVWLHGEKIRWAR